jgi:sec-independent protein translocase protein TatB
MGRKLRVKMAAEFQSQFQEAMREAEMADLKRSFDEVREAASVFGSGNIMTSLQKDVTDALRIDDIDKPAAAIEPLAAAAPEAVAATEPLAITPEVQSSAPPQENVVAAPNELKDAKAS